MLKYLYVFVSSPWLSLTANNIIKKKLNQLHDILAESNILYTKFSIVLKNYIENKEINTPK